MREGVHVEGEADVCFGGVEDGFAAGAAGIVDEDGGVAEGAADGGGGGGDGVFGGEVALEVVDGGGSCGVLAALLDWVYGTHLGM